jgi:hypothetical protein
MKTDSILIFYNKTGLRIFKAKSGRHPLRCRLIENKSAGARHAVPLLADLSKGLMFEKRGIRMKKT